MSSLHALHRAWHGSVMLTRGAFNVMATMPEVVALHSVPRVADSDASAMQAAGLSGLWKLQCQQADDSADSERLRRGRTAGIPSLTKDLRLDLRPTGTEIAALSVRLLEQRTGATAHQRNCLTSGPSACQCWSRHQLSRK